MFARRGDVVQGGMTAGNHERHQRENGRLFAQQSGGDVPFQVIHADQGFARDVGQRLGDADAHQQGAHQSRPVGDGDAVDFIQRRSGLGQRAADQGKYFVEVQSRGDLGDNSAITGVVLHLRPNLGGENFPSVPEHRAGGLVAGTLDAQH